jgi:cytochrome P450
VAGHETTAAALFWSLYLMTSAPDEQRAVAAEVASVDLGPEGAADAAPQLIRTRAIVDEALRLYPPAFVNRPPGVRRRPHRWDPCARAVAGPGRPPGSCTGAVGFGTNRRPLIRRDSYLTLRHRPFFYLPFGAGPRVCIGAQFALTELILLVAIMFGTFGSGLPNLASSGRSGSSALSRTIHHPSCCSFAGNRAPRRFIHSQSPFLRVENSQARGPWLGIAL